MIARIRKKKEQKNMNQEKSQENTEKEKRKERPFIVENKGITSEKMQRKRKSKVKKGQQMYL